MIFHDFYIMCSCDYDPVIIQQYVELFRFEKIWQYATIL